MISFFLSTGILWGLFCMLIALCTYASVLMFHIWIEAALFSCHSYPKVMLRLGLFCIGRYLISLHQSAHNSLSTVSWFFFEMPSGLSNIAIMSYWVNCDVYFLLFVEGVRFPVLGNSFSSLLVDCKNNPVNKLLQWIPISIHCCYDLAVL